MILETLPAVQSLGRDDKLRLAYELWEDASDDDVALDAAAEKLLAERLAAYDADPGNVLTMEQAAKRMDDFKDRIARERRNREA